MLLAGQNFTWKILQTPTQNFNLLTQSNTDPENKYIDQPFHLSVKSMKVDSGRETHYQSISQSVNRSTNQSVS